MNSSTTVKNQYLADTFRKVSQIVARRPVSHLAAATFLATHVHVAHEGLMSALPSSLGWSLTGLVVAIATLQWLAHGRHEACLAERDHDRADAVIHQAWMFGVIETCLLTIGVVALCAREGVNMMTPAGITVAVIGSALFAFCSFRVKWTSCDAVTLRKVPATTAHSIFGDMDPPPADKAPVLSDQSCDDVGVISLETRIRQREALAAADRKAQATVKKSAAQRLERATGRIRTRHYRSLKRAAA